MLQLLHADVGKRLNRQAHRAVQERVPRNGDTAAGPPVCRTPPAAQARGGAARRLPIRARREAGKGVVLDRRATCTAIVAIASIDLHTAQRGRT